MCRISFVFSAGLHVMLVAVVLCSLQAVRAEIVNDPMKPPAYALRQYKIATLKQNGTHLQNKPAVKQSQKKSFQLSTILIAKDRKIAVINDEMLAVNDRIDNARVVSIHEDRVELIENGKRIKLVLYKDSLSVSKSLAKSNK